LKPCFGRMACLWPFQRAPIKCNGAGWGTRAEASWMGRAHRSPDYAGVEDRVSAEENHQHAHHLRRFVAQKHFMEPIARAHAEGKLTSAATLGSRHRGAWT